MIKAERLVEPNIDSMMEDIKDDGVLNIDETTVPVLHRPGEKSANPGYMWVMARARSGPRIITFTRDSSNSGRVAERFLAGHCRMIVTDGLDGYNRVTSRGMVNAAC